MSQPPAWKVRLEADRERAAQVKAERDAAKQRKVAEIVAAAGTAYAELAEDGDDGDELRDSTSKLDTRGTFAQSDDALSFTASAYASDASRYGAAIFADDELDDATRETYLNDDDGDELLSVGYGQPALSGGAYEEPEENARVYDEAPKKVDELSPYETPDASVVAVVATKTNDSVDPYDSPDPSKVVVKQSAPAADPYETPIASKPTPTPTDGYDVPSNTVTATKPVVAAAASSSSRPVVQANHQSCFNNS
jgi:hypothetical protein